MEQLRALTAAEILELEAGGSICTQWSQVRVSSDFSTSQIVRSRLEGRVELESNARIAFSFVSNYHLGRNVVIDSVQRMECRTKSSFGNGVQVATINEGGGRTIKIYDSLTAQCAYIMAVYRHRPQLIAAMEGMVDNYARELSSAIGRVGENSTITNSKIIRETKVGSSVVVDGASILENATLCDRAKVGVDVKAYDFIAAEDSRIDNGAIVERCFVGERVIVSNGFTAVDSLFFASSHFENGEAASIFAGPYTVSHHKSSLLIAGIFSFFNAGSGSNQSNHLFKCGAVHQAAHLRGCKFSSSAYVMSPAKEGAFTTILGRHPHHHDTTKFPYSYLAERDGKSVLIPAMNLTNYGTVRDLDKWIKRDKRTLKRDIVNLEEHNPYLCQYIVQAIEELEQLRSNSPQADLYIYSSVSITSNALRRALSLYTKALEASIGAMLSVSGLSVCGAEGSWVDLGGQFISHHSLDELLQKVESGELVTTSQIDIYLQGFCAQYQDYAFNWALWQLSRQLGCRPTSDDIRLAIECGAASREQLKELSMSDMQKDFSPSMMVSYGLDSEDNFDDMRADFNSVRGVK